MDTKILLSGLVGFFIGGLLVSVASTYDNPTRQAHDDITMRQMTDELRSKTGDEYDRAFIEHMIGHHEGAVDMARLSAGNARHQEIKDLSSDIIRAQTAEIEQLKKWQAAWGYDDASSHAGH